MKVSYKKLFKLMIDREIKKGKLAEMASLSSSSIAIPYVRCLTQ